MDQIVLNVRKFGAHLSRYLKQVQAGLTIVVTVRGRPVALISPITPPMDEELKALTDTEPRKGVE